jgi:hypothetical protein
LPKIRDTSRRTTTHHKEQPFSTNQITNKATKRAVVARPIKSRIRAVVKEITGDGMNFEALGYGSNIPNYVYVEATEAIPRTTTVYST